ncbi:hypothetical protein D3C81_1514410 [compost metagenome]
MNDILVLVIFSLVCSGMNKFLQLWRPTVDTRFAKINFYLMLLLPTIRCIKAEADRRCISVIRTDLTRLYAEIRRSIRLFYFQAWQYWYRSN